MKESDFAEQISRWIRDQKKYWADALVSEGYENAAIQVREQLRVEKSCRLHTGFILGWDHTQECYRWNTFDREVDLAVGVSVEHGELTGQFVPLLAIELKSQSFNSDELDKKSAIYGALREVYPWIGRVFIHYDQTSLRALADDYLFRNGRNFDLILNEWLQTSGSEEVLQGYILHTLRYCLGYWEF